MATAEAGVAPFRWVDRRAWAIALALFLVCFFVVLLTADAYGPTYDEPFYTTGGRLYAQWWGRALHFDLSALTGSEIDAAWGYNHEHPPLQKVASGVSQALFGGVLPGLTAMRLPSAVWFGLVVAALYLFLIPVWGRAGALFSALALATLPRFFAHAHFIALDMPIAAWFFLSVAVAALAAERDSWQWAVAAGIAFGLALAAKVNAFFIPILVGPWVLLFHRRSWLKLVVAFAVIGPVVFFLSWPWLWVAPLAHLRGYLDFHFGHAAYNVWYLGKLYQYAPWHYPFVMTAVTTPVLVLLCALAGMARCRPRTNARQALLLLGLAMALLPSALPSSPKYNGVRLFLPALPFLAALTGGAFAWIADRVARTCEKRPDGARTAALATVGLGALLLAPGVRGAALAHPYQLAYYNEAVGGTWGATRKGFETIYWGQVFQDAEGFLNGIGTAGVSGPESRDTRPRVLVIPKGVISLLDLQQEAGTLRKDLHFTGDQNEAARVDYVMFQAMQSDYTLLCWELAEHAKPVYALATGEAPLLLVYDRAAVSAALARLSTNRAAPDPSKLRPASSDT